MQPGGHRFEPGILHFDHFAKASGLCCSAGALRPASQGKSQRPPAFAQPHRCWRDAASREGQTDPLETSRCGGYIRGRLVERLTLLRSWPRPQTRLERGSPRHAALHWQAARELAAGSFKNRSFTIEYPANGSFFRPQKTLVCSTPAQAGETGASQLKSRRAQCARSYRMQLSAIGCQRSVAILRAERLSAVSCER